LRPRGGGRVTIRDVAQEAGVSRQTVSRVVNGDPRVSQETRESVRRAIETLRFQPNYIARSLATRRTDTIGFIVSDIGNPFFPDILAGAEDVLGEQGCSLFLSNTRDDPDREYAALRSMVRKRVDGIILYSRMPDAMLDGLVQSFEIPTVLLNRRGKGEHLGVVRTARLQGAYQAASHLRSLGHTEIALVCSTSNEQGTRERIEGYESALREAAGQAEPRVLRESLSMGGGYRAGCHLLEAYRDVTGVLCHNDLMAIGLVQAATERGLRVPRDLSVIGWDDVTYASLVSPPLTTVRVPRYEMGKVAARLLMDLMQQRPGEREAMLPVELVVRGSCGPR